TTLRAVALRPPLPIYHPEREHGANIAWPFGRERSTEVLMGIDGCSPWILKLAGCSSGTSPTCPQAVKSPILRSEPFSSRPATDPRSRNFCVSLQRWSRVRRPQGPKGDKRHLKDAAANFVKLRGSSGPRPAIAPHP